MGSSIKRIRYEYDEVGNRRALIDPDGGRFTYTYDAVSRIQEVQNPQGDRTSYSYDPAGRRTVKEMANGTRASFSYDPAGNLTGLYNLKSGGTVISSFDYAYDKVGNRTAVLEADGSRVTWSYDDTYQLTGEHRTGTSPYRDTYTYDPTGNRLLKIHDGARTTYAYDAANQLTFSEDVSGRTTYTFDADGNQQVVRVPNGDRTTYVWDYENRMTSVRLPSGIRNTMAYDADGLRVKLEESTGTKKFVWDDQNYLAETDENNDTIVVYTNEPRLYGNLISQRRGSTSHWYHFDAIGSTRELTNASAVITDTKLYDAWGCPMSTSGVTSTPFGFASSVGYFHDVEVKTTYVRARTYASASARWLSGDLLTLERTAVYARNNPVTLFDPSGMQPESNPAQMLDLCECLLEEVLGDVSVAEDPFVRRALACNVYISCESDCAAGRAGGLTGNTFVFPWPPTSTSRIFVCLDASRIGLNPLDMVAILLHETTHVDWFLRRHRRLCHTDPFTGDMPAPPELSPNTDCDLCIDAEEPAYRRQCGVYNWLTPADQEQCVKAGVCFSCSSACSPAELPPGSTDAAGNCIPFPQYRGPNVAPLTPLPPVSIDPKDLPGPDTIPNPLPDPTFDLFLRLHRR